MQSEPDAGRFAEILLVEDNPDDEQLTIEALKDAHITNSVHVVRDGAAALEFLIPQSGQRTTALKVVLLDIKLPKVDGLEVLRQMRAHPATANTPVVLLTSSAEERDIHRGYELKANSYIVKPVDFVQFARAVEDIGAYWALLNKPPLRHHAGKAPAAVT